jgi:dipeptide transport system ATP-binding protein
MTSLNPVLSVGRQIGEAVHLHQGLRGRALKARCVELLEDVGIGDAAARLDDYPHQLSGGMKQRVMIAMALAGDPEVLIADEPTTALDVTIQAQILELLVELQRERGMALVLITHDMGVVAETAERVVVQYAGQQVEKQTVEGLFADPHHPYTAALLAALPERATAKRLPSIPGVVPGQMDRPEGCLFNPRCRFATERCKREAPRMDGPPLPGVRCHYALKAGVPQGHPETVGEPA